VDQLRGYKIALESYNAWSPRISKMKLKLSLKSKSDSS
jgi:hypothetical protein